jgi:hypothetical protein
MDEVTFVTRKTYRRIWWCGALLLGGIQVLTTITLYKPNGDPITYMDPTNMNVENGVITFYWVKEISGKAQKIMTNLPFLIQHDVMGR